MDKQIFIKHKGEFIKITLKPTDFALRGWIDNIFEDCIEFRTSQKTSYIEFDKVSSLVPIGW